MVGNRAARRCRTTLMCCSSVVEFIFELSSQRWRECTVSPGTPASGNVDTGSPAHSRCAATVSALPSCQSGAFRRVRARWVQVPPNQQLRRHLHSTSRVCRLVCPRRPRRHVTTMTKQTLPENGPIGLFHFLGADMSSAVSIRLPCCAQITSAVIDAVGSARLDATAMAAASWPKNYHLPACRGADTTAGKRTRSAGLYLRTDRAGAGCRGRPIQYSHRWPADPATTACRLGDRICPVTESACAVSRGQDARGRARLCAGIGFRSQSTCPGGMNVGCRSAPISISQSLWCSSRWWNPQSSTRLPMSDGPPADQ